MRLRFLEGTVFRAVSGQDVDFDSCDLGIFDELRRFLDGSGVHCAFVSGYQKVQALREALDGVCHGLVPFGTLPARKRGAALGGRRQLLHIFRGYRESALRASRAAVGRPQRREGLGTGQRADEGY